MKICVTGAAGFIGSHVVRLLLQRNYQVRALHLPADNLFNLSDLHAEQEIEKISGDVTCVEDMRRAMCGCDAVIHLAAIYALWMPNPQLMRKVNVQGTANVLAVAKELGLQRVVCTSSIARFGGQGLEVSATEESPFALAATGSVYAITKAEGHELAKQAAREQDVVICAPCGPIGPGDIGPTPTGRLLLAAAALPIMVTPPTVSNFGDVRDIALGHVLALEKGQRGESYLLGTENLTALELIDMVMELRGKHKPAFAVPFSLAKLAGRASYWFADNVSRNAPLITADSIDIAQLGLAADCSKAVKELGLPQTPLRTSVKDALDWFEQRGYLDTKTVAKQLLGF